MSQSNSNSRKPFMVVLAVVSIAAVVFAVLWLRERERKPTEVIREVEKPVQVIKEVPVEKIREIPKEVIKEVEVIREVEVPAKLTDAQKAAIDFSVRFFGAQLVKSKDEVFYKVESVAVSVLMNNAVKKVVSEDRVRNKFELVLRQHNIQLDEKAPVLLEVAIEGLWDKDDIRLTFTRSIGLVEHVTIGRKSDLRQTLATTWDESSFGYAGKAVAEKAIMDSVEAMAESFANKFLASRDKEAKRETAK